MASPSTLSPTSASGEVAGPPCGEPSSIENWLPWHGQWIRPSETVATWQPWCVHVELKPLNEPSVGWVTTTCWSEKIVPPPTSMSEAEASPPVEPPDELSAPLGDVPPSGVPAEEPLPPGS